MTVQEAKEVLDNIWDFVDANGEEEGEIVDDAINKTIESIEELEKQPKTDWIPCEVEMPKEMKEVLISRENSKTGTSVGYYNRVFGWYDQCLLRGVTDVVAWMPKPIEYKKEGAEDTNVP